MGMPTGCYDNYVEAEVAERRGLLRETELLKERNAKLMEKIADMEADKKLARKLYNG